MSLNSSSYGVRAGRGGWKGWEFVIQMKFRPRRHLGEDPEGLIVPIEVLVPDQTLPVIFRLRAQLTSSDVVFDPPSIDFGPCFTEQSVSFPLRITNTCALPQRFGFVQLPRELSVPESDGFGTLLPGETIVRDIVFSPVSAVNHDCALRLRTFLNRDFTVRCRGVGIARGSPFHTLSSIFLPLREGSPSWRALSCGTPLQMGAGKFLSLEHRRSAALGCASARRARK